MPAAISSSEDYTAGQRYSIMNPEVFSREVADVVSANSKRCGLGPSAMKSTHSFAIDIGEDNRPSEGQHSTRWGSLPERMAFAEADHIEPSPEIVRTLVVSLPVAF